MSRQDSTRRKGFGSVVDNARQWAAKWGVRIAIALVVVLFILESTHVIENVNLEFILATTVFFLIAEKLDYSNEQLKASVERNSAIYGLGAPRLYTLQECFKEMNENFDKVSRGEMVTVRHIGLDMVTAWEPIQNLLSSEKLLANVDYQLLILSHDSSKLALISPEIEEWCQRASLSLPKIRRDMPNIKKIFRSNGRKIEFSCKEYEYVPFIHGIEFRGPIDFCYLAICRWGGPNSDRLGWGEASYIRLADTIDDPVQADLRRTFRSFFGRHWRARDECAVYESTEIA